MTAMLKGINTKELMGRLQQIDGVEMFTKLGLSKEEAEKVLQGDYSDLVKRGPENYIVDFETITKFHKNKFNPNLVKFFFSKVKQNEPYTEEEIKSYRGAFEDWFKLIFYVAKNFIITLDKEEQDETIVIKLGQDYYTMSIMNKVNLIVYLGKSNPIKNLVATKTSHS